MSQNDPFAPSSDQTQAVQTPPAPAWHQPVPYPTGTAVPPQAPYPAGTAVPPQAPYALQPAPRTNTMAIMGLVFAFVFAPLGIVFGAIGLKQVKQRGEGGRGLAMSGVIIGSVFTAIWVATMVFVIALAGSAVSVSGPPVPAPSSVPDVAPSSVPQVAPSSAPQVDTAAQVNGACQVIEPTINRATTALQNSTTAEDFGAQIDTLDAQLSGAASATNDPSFTSHVQKLVADLDTVAQDVRSGQDPSGLEQQLNSDGAAVDADCAAAGYTGQ